MDLPATFHLRSLPDNTATYELVSFRCQCGTHLRFYASTLQVVTQASQERRVEMPSALADGHAVIFEAGKATAIRCPEDST